MCCATVDDTQSIIKMPIDIVAKIYRKLTILASFGDKCNFSSLNACKSQNDTQRLSPPEAQYMYCESLISFATWVDEIMTAGSKVAIGAMGIPNGLPVDAGILFSFIFHNVMHPSPSEKSLSAT